MLATAGAYGVSFELTDHFRSLGGNETDTGRVLFGAALGSFLSVILVGSAVDRSDLRLSARWARRPSAQAWRAFL